MAESKQDNNAAEVTRCPSTSTRSNSGEVCTAGAHLDAHGYDLALAFMPRRLGKAG